MTEPLSTQSRSPRRTSGPSTSTAGESAHSLGTVVGASAPAAPDRGRKVVDSSGDRVQEALDGATEKAQQAKDVAADEARDAAGAAVQRAQDAVADIGGRARDRVDDAGARAHETLGDIGDQVADLQQAATPVARGAMDRIRRNPAALVIALVVLAVLLRRIAGRRR